MTEMYVTFIPVATGIDEVKTNTLFTCCSGLAKKWAEDNQHMGATYHVMNIGSALPID